MVSTDGGHTGGSAEFALDAQARIDHAYNAFDKTAVNAKDVATNLTLARRPDVGELLRYQPHAGATRHRAAGAACCCRTTACTPRANTRKGR